jgi:PTH1 family peptidyl-tRNA hydrolase
MALPADTRMGAGKAAHAAARLIVGLGNPGREYENTRHNIGFLVIDRLATRLGLGAFAFSNHWQALWTRDAGGAVFVKPQTFMNASGRAVGAVARYYKIPAAEILVVYDDLALPLGRLRLRPQGSAGGHNGLQTLEVPRLRIGIGGSSGGRAMVGHVLGKFRPDEAPAVGDAVERASETVEIVRRDGLESAMNLFNRPDPLPG